MRNEFAKELSRQLLEYYGRIPSAAVLARDFNLRAAHVPQISQETARRWIRGLSIPEIDKLQVLFDWLGLESDFIRGPAQTTSSQTDGDYGASRRTRMLPIETALIAVFRETDSRGKQMLLSMANTLIPGKIPPSAL